MGRLQCCSHFMPLTRKPTGRCYLQHCAQAQSLSPFTACAARRRSPGMVPPGGFTRVSAHGQSHFWASADQFNLTMIAVTLGTCLASRFKLCSLQKDHFQGHRRPFHLTVLWAALDWPQPCPLAAGGFQRALSTPGTLQIHSRDSGHRFSLHWEPETPPLDIRHHVFWWYMLFFPIYILLPLQQAWS